MTPATLREQTQENFSTELAQPIRTEWPEARLSLFASEPLRAGVDMPARPQKPDEKRYIRTTDIHSLTRLTATPAGIPASSINGATVRKDDILFTRAGSLGTSYHHIGEEEHAYAGYLVRFRPRAEVCVPGYVAWWSQSQHHLEQIQEGATHSTISNFSASKFSAMKLPVPPLETQAAIAEYLDAETGKIDAMVADLERLVEALRERKKALGVTTLFPHGIPGDLTSQSAYKSLGYSGTRRIGDVCVPRNVKNQDTTAQYLSLMRGVGVIRYEDKGDVGNKKPEDLTRCKVVEPGDYVVNSMNFGIGSYGRSELTGVCSTAYLVFTPNPSLIHPRLLAHVFLSDDFRQRVQDLGNGILEHRKSIPWERLHAVRIPYFTLNKQQRLVNHLDRETAAIDGEISDAQKLKELLQERRSVLIDEVVTGRKKVA